MKVSEDRVHELLYRHPDPRAIEVAAKEPQIQVKIDGQVIVIDGVTAWLEVIPLPEAGT